MEKKYWKSQGILSVQKSRNHAKSKTKVEMTVYQLLSVKYFKWVS